MPKWHDAVNYINLQIGATYPTTTLYAVYAGEMIAVEIVNTEHVEAGPT
jgi:hypothetical protein